MNYITTIGNLTNDPVIRDANGVSVCTFTLASNTRRKDDSGNPIANFYRVNVWRALGDNCAKYLHKGDRAAVTGDLALRTYTGNDGTTRYSLDVTAQDVVFLQDRRADAAQATVKPVQAKAAAPAPAQDDEDEDLPF